MISLTQRSGTVARLVWVDYHGCLLCVPFLLTALLTSLGFRPCHRIWSRTSTEVADILRWNSVVRSLIGVDLRLFLASEAAVLYSGRMLFCYYLVLANRIEVITSPKSTTLVAAIFRRSTHVMKLFQLQHSLLVRALNIQRAEFTRTACHGSLGREQTRTKPLNCTASSINRQRDGVAACMRAYISLISVYYRGVGICSVVSTNSCVSLITTHACSWYPLMHVVVDHSKVCR